MTVKLIYHLRRGYKKLPDHLRSVCIARGAFISSSIISRGWSVSVAITRGVSHRKERVIFSPVS